MGEASTGRPSSDHPARGGHRAVHRRTLRAVPSGSGVGRIAPGHRIWLHVDGVRMFGPGMHELLGHVADTRVTKKNDAHTHTHTSHIHASRTR